VGSRRLLSRGVTVVAPGRFSTLTVLLLLSCLWLTAAASGAQRTYVENDIVGGKLTYKPHQMVLVADGTLALDHIDWLSYGGRDARGKATAYVRNCVPDCARGKVTRPAARLTLSHRIECHGVTVYTRISYHLSDPLPSGLRHRGSQILRPEGC
jgi:hypothetical protein